MIEQQPRDPIWLQAALEAVAAFRYGDLITYGWLHEHLKISAPADVMTAEQFRALSFETLTKVDGFRDALLTNHQRYLSNVRGVGYTIVPPPHQTTEAMTLLQRELHKSVNKAAAALVHINVHALSLADVRDNAEARSKLAWLRTVGMRKLTARASAETRTVVLAPA